MMNNPRTLLLLGASGLVGSECLNILAQSDFYQKILLFTRRPLPQLPGDARIIQHIINFDRPASYRDLLKTDQVICALGTTIKKAGSREAFSKVDFTYPYEIAKIARENGAGHFLLVSSIGADPHSGIFYSRVKGEIESAIQSLDFRSVSIFRPSLLLGERPETRTGEKIAEFFGTRLSFAIPKRYRPIPARVVAGAIVKTAMEDRPGLRILESEKIRRIYRENEK
jgi:uncharacterized protein YbjT (DUF2867 family)